MKNVFTTIFLSLISISALAECYIVGNLKGFSTSQMNGFSLGRDGIGKFKFEVSLDSESPTVSMSPQMSCGLSGKNSLLCQDIYNDGRSVIETWVVIPEIKKVFKTKSVSGFKTSDGGHALIGDILGSCSST